MSAKDIIIIGGGVVGASAGYHLARAGAEVLLIDNRDAGRATDAGAGILSPETSGTGIAPAWFDFALHSGAFYSQLIEDLRAEGAGDTGYAVCGILVVAADEDELAAYEVKKGVIFERQRQRGLPSADDLHEVTPQEAKELFPPLKSVLKALYFRGGARVDGRLLAGAMLRSARHYGLEVQAGRVEQLILQDRRVTGVSILGRTLPASKVIIAGGAWSAAFGQQLGVQIQVEPQRGQIIHLRLTDTQTDSGQWPVVEAFHDHYLVCWPDGRVVAGATRETGSGFTVQTTAAGVHQVLGEALRVAPGLSHAALGEIRIGLRPRTVDSMPVLGTVPGFDNVYLATGHGANGLQLGPISGKLAADWALNQPDTVDISAFHISRWGK